MSFGWSVGDVTELLQRLVPIRLCTNTLLSDMIFALALHFIVGYRKLANHHHFHVLLVSSILLKVSEDVRQESRPSQIETITQSCNNVDSPDIYSFCLCIVTDTRQ